MARFRKQFVLWLGRTICQAKTCFERSDTSVARLLDWEDRAFIDLEVIEKPYPLDRRV